MAELVDDLVKIFLYQYIDMALVNFETARILKMCGYEDFVAEKNGMRAQIEKRCWHFSEAKYVGHMGPNPYEYYTNDMDDPYNTQKDPPYVNVPDYLPGDDLVPVFPSQWSRAEVSRAEAEWRNKSRNQTNSGHCMFLELFVTSILENHWILQRKKTGTKQH